MEDDDRELGHRVVTLPDGRRLVLRPVTRDDVDGLVELYAGLTVDDLYLRFFSVYHPDRRFLERVATSAERGGFGLVAYLGGDGEDGGRIVAEAGYELLPDGDGELAITVADGWRGWLGPFLLDALAEAAAARGVPNLEADVLMGNAAMLALLRERGYATMANDDWATVRAVVSTAGPVPSWPDRPGRPRILVEVPGARWHAGMAADAAGLAVLACPGPPGRRIRCPALAGQPCPLAADADAIVMSHVGHDDRWDALVSAHRRLHPGVPVCVEVPRGDAGRGVPHVPADEDDTAVVAFVERLARRSGRAVRPDRADAGGGPADDADDADDAGPGGGR